MNNATKQTSGSQKNKGMKKGDGKSGVGSKRKREPGAFVSTDKKETERRRQSGFHVSF
jgi:hypothetical protein